MNKICVYAICRNEAKFVDKWVDSMSEADSIVVLDTGSTDDTVEKLKARGVKVAVKYYNPWRFDTPRNDAMDMAPADCNILVSTDLDEILMPGWADALRSKWIEGVHERADYQYVWSHQEDGSNGRVFTYNKVHSRNWRWRAPVHELLYNINTGSESYSVDNCLNLWNEMILHHYPDQTKSRSSYLPLLELRKEESPDDYYGRIYLAHEYFYRGHYQKSIDELNYVLNNFQEKTNSTDAASCYLFMGDDYHKLNKPYDAIKCYLQSINTDARYREGYIAASKVYIELKMYDAAKQILIQGLKNSVRLYSWLEKDTSWTWDLYLQLTLACYYGEDKLSAIGYAAKALSYEPNNELLKSNLKLCIENSKDSELI